MKCVYFFLFSFHYTFVFPATKKTQRRKLRCFNKTLCVLLYQRTDPNQCIYIHIWANDFCVLAFICMTMIMCLHRQRRLRRWWRRRRPLHTYAVFESILSHREFCVCWCNVQNKILKLKHETTNKIDAGLNRIESKRKKKFFLYSIYV